MRLNPKKSSKKQPRKSSKKPNELKGEISLKQFAPSTIKLQPPDDRTFDAGLEGENVDDLTEVLLRIDKKQHAWSDTVVVREGTILNNKVVENAGTVLGMMDMYQFDMSCMKKPENYFCLKKVSDKMGYGLFAKRDIKKG